MGGVSSKNKTKKTQSTGRNRRLSVTAGGQGDGGSDGSVQYLPQGDRKEEGECGSPPLAFYSFSQAGYEPDHVKKTNQDRFLNYKDAGENKHLFGVFDGHGARGHEVSEYIIKTMPREVVANQGKVDSDIISGMTAVFKATDSALKKNKSIDCSLSGTTAVTVVVDRSGIEPQLVMSNLGDSRAVLAVEEGGKLKAIELTEDQKPEREDEKRRIHASGGRTEPLMDETGEAIGPCRVWLSNMLLPGLAMTRSFGDLVAESVGVIAVPEVKTVPLPSNAKFLILASDGVWEFLSNQQSVDIVARGSHGMPAVEDLVLRSLKEWNQEEEVVDDITATVVYF